MIDSVVIAAGVRTPIGAFGGSLAGHAPTELGALCVAEALSRAKTSGEDVGHVVFGNVILTETRDAYLARIVAMNGGVPKEAPAMTVNRLCGSGVQSIISAAQSIMLGDVEVAVAGGAEVMSRAPHLIAAARSGQKLGDVSAVDHLLGVLTDPFGSGSMGITAENVAAKWRISRDEQDRFAAESQRRAGEAIAAGRFRDQILPVVIQRARSVVQFETDEHPKPDTTVAGLSGLRPVFQKDGTVTAGNASGINDGAAAVVLMRETWAAAHGRPMLARIVGYAHAGVAPGEMGIGPVPAVRRLLERVKLKIGAFDVIEANEAFAAQACAVANELGFDPAKVNPNGGAIALGHPVGATGTMLVIKATYELRRIGGRYGLVTMCIGGGQGIALAIERVV